MTNIISQVSGRTIAVIDGLAQSIDRSTILVAGTLIEFVVPIECQDLEKLETQGEQGKCRTMISGAIPANLKK